MLHATTLRLSPLVLLALAGGAHAQSNWPSFRGPAGGQASSFALAPDAAPDGAAWHIQLPGAGHSSPVVWGAQVFVTCADPESDARILVALGLEDGKEQARASFPFSTYRTHRLNGYVSSTPSVDEHGVYLAWNEGGRLIAHGLDHDLKLRWRKDLGPHACGHGWGGSSGLQDGTLIIPSDSDAEESFLVGLDPTDGSERWRRTRSSQRGAYSSPVPGTVEGEVLFGSTAHGLTMLNSSTGELIWEVDDLFESRVVASPVVTDEVAWLMGGSGGGGKHFAAVALPGQADAGQIRYRLRRNLPYVPSPVYGNGRAYLFSDGGIASAYRTSDGSLLWSERVDGEFFGSPILAGEQLYALTKSGDLIVLAAGETFTHLATLSLGERAFSTPAFAQGRLLLRTETQLFAFASKPNKSR